MGPDGTLRVKSDSPEGRFFLDRIGDDFREDLTLGAHGSVGTTLQAGGRSLNFNVNAAVKQRPKLPRSKIASTDAKGSPRIWTPLASTTFGREEYAFEWASPYGYRQSEAMARRATALRLLGAEGEKHLLVEEEEERRFFAQIASHTIDERRIPERGSAFSSLPAEVRDDIESQIRSNPKMYGFSDEGDAAKWLAGASVARSKAATGLAIDGGTGISAAMIASRFY